jgi:hypothetical protein
VSLAGVGSLEHAHSKTVSTVTASGGVAVANKILLGHMRMEALLTLLADV